MKVEVIEYALDQEAREHVPKAVADLLKTIEVSFDPATVVLRLAGTREAGEALDVDPLQLLETQWMISEIDLAEGLLVLTMAAGTSKKVTSPFRQ